MVEPETAFNEAWAGIGSCVKAGRYQGAANIAYDAAHLGWALKRQDDLFISEVLGSACMDIAGAIGEYAVPTADIQKINDTMARHMADLLSAYTAGQDATKVLKRMRYDATVFHLYTEQRWRQTAKTNEGREIAAQTARVHRRRTAYESQNRRIQIKAQRRARLYGDYPEHSPARSFDSIAAAVALLASSREGPVVKGEPTFDAETFARVLELLGTAGISELDDAWTGAAMHAGTSSYDDGGERAAYERQAVASAKKISAALGPVDPQEVVGMVRADRDTR